MTAAPVAAVRILSLAAALAIVAVLAAALRSALREGFVEPLDDCVIVNAETLGALSLLCLIRLVVRGDSEALGAILTLLQFCVGFSRGEALRK